MGRELPSTPARDCGEERNCPHLGPADTEASLHFSESQEKSLSGLGKKPDARARRRPARGQASVEKELCQPRSLLALRKHLAHGHRELIDRKVGVDDAAVNRLVTVEYSCGLRLLRLSRLCANRRSCAREQPRIRGRTGRPGTAWAALESGRVGPGGRRWGRRRAAARVAGSTPRRRSRRPIPVWPTWNAKWAGRRWSSTTSIASMSGHGTPVKRREHRPGPTAGLYFTLL